MERLNVKPYKKNENYSYLFGAYAVLNLIEEKPEIIRGVLIHSQYDDDRKLIDLCRRNNIPYLISDKAINRLSDKENIYVIGIFNKYEMILNKAEPHIVLVQPRDMGNLGTIIRTAAGFNIRNIAIIGPAADIFHPKTLRASMGALFSVQLQYFDSFLAYQTQFPMHDFYPFMLKEASSLKMCVKNSSPLFSLIFGNEAAGLPDEFSTIGQPIKIPQSHAVDSLNLSIAVGIAAYSFAFHHELIT